MNNGGGFLQGQIIKAVSGFYYVATAQGEIFQTRGRGILRQKKLAPLVGDYVEFSAANQTDGALEEILPRKNQMIRPTVANVDLGVVVMSARKPNFSLNLLDRFLVHLEFFKISALLFVTKLDLVEDMDQDEFLTLQKDYQKIGYPVILSNKNELEKYFPHQLTVFMGQSGAGKSTLLNELAPDLTLATGEISESLGRGRHTTRHVELHPLFNGLIADTPGFSSLDFPDEMTAEVLPYLFPEIGETSAGCKFRQCSHTNEPGCAVKEAVLNHEILTSRYENYQQFLKEIKEKKPQYKKGV